MSKTVFKTVSVSFSVFFVYLENAECINFTLNSINEDIQYSIRLWYDMLQVRLTDFTQPNRRSWWNLHTRKFTP